MMAVTCNRCSRGDCSVVDARDRASERSLSGKSEGGRDRPLLAGCCPSRCINGLAPGIQLTRSANSSLVGTSRHRFLQDSRSLDGQSERGRTQQSGVRAKLPRYGRSPGDHGCRRFRSQRWWIAQPSAVQGILEGLTGFYRSRSTRPHRAFRRMSRPVSDRQPRSTRRWSLRDPLLSFVNVRSPAASIARLP